MPSCIDSVMNYCKVDSLSPLKLVEQVKPESTLSRQLPVNQRLLVASANFLNCQLAIPI